MASSPARRRLLPLLLLLAALSSRSISICAAVERRCSEMPATAPAADAGRVARQEFHVAPAAKAVARVPRTSAPARVSGKTGDARRPTTVWKRGARRGRGGGTGAWAFSAMLPRGFVPPSGSSACHNDMPATAADAQFFACGGVESPWQRGLSP